VGLGNREQLAGTLAGLRTPVVRNVVLAARAHGGSVRSAAGRGDYAHLAVRRDARERTPLDLDQDHRTVGHRHRAFGKAQTRRDLLERWPDRFQLRLLTRVVPGA